MPWTIKMQEESVGKGEKIPVKVKQIKFFPIEGKGGQIEGFKALGFLLLQVIIENQRGETLKLKLNASQGINSPTFTVQHEDTMDHPTIWVGEGKRRMQIKDVLAPKQKIPGEKEKYDRVDFEKRVKQFGGEALVDEVMTLFVTKLAEVMSAADGKAKKAKAK